MNTEVASPQDFSTILASAASPQSPQTSLGSMADPDNLSKVEMSNEQVPKLTHGPKVTLQVHQPTNIEPDLPQPIKMGSELLQPITAETEMSQPVIEDKCSSNNLKREMDIETEENTASTSAPPIKKQALMSQPMTEQRDILEPIEDDSEPRQPINEQQMDENSQGIEPEQSKNDEIPNIKICPEEKMKVRALNINEALSQLEHQNNWTSKEFHMIVNVLKHHLKLLKTISKFEEGLIVCNDILSKLDDNYNSEILNWKYIFLSRLNRLKEAFLVSEQVYVKRSTKHGQCNAYSLDALREMFKTATELDSEDQSEAWKTCLALLSQNQEQEDLSDKSKVALGKFLNELVRYLQERKYELKSVCVDEFLLKYKSNYKVTSSVVVKQAHGLLKSKNLDAASDHLLSHMNDSEFSIADSNVALDTFVMACQLQDLGKTDALVKWSELIKLNTTDDFKSKLLTQSRKSFNCIQKELFSKIINNCLGLTESKDLSILELVTETVNNFNKKKAKYLSMKKDKVPRKKAIYLGNNKYKLVPITRPTPKSKTGSKGPIKKK